MQEYDLVIVGSGSGNSIPGPDTADWDVAIVEAGVFGGTCLNRGCIPSKILVHTADVAATVAGAGRFGLAATLDGVDWGGIVARTFGHVDPIVADGEAYRRSNPGEHVVAGEARFVGPRLLDVGGERITAPRIVLAAGARPLVPPIPGLHDVGFHTSDTVMRVEELPPRLLVLGGGYIAAELGHVFGSLGSDVTIVTRGPTMLSGEDHEVRHAVTDAYARRHEVVLDAAVHEARREAGEVVLDATSRGAPRTLRGDALLVAVGRVPNSDRLHVREAGVRVHGDGRVMVDDTLATDAPGIWAFGDLANPYQLKHVANAEARVVAHNLAHPDAPRRMDYSVVPHAVFGAPQVASVGMTEEHVVDDEIPYTAARARYGDTAYGWALEDDEGFVKLLAHAETRHLLGAHVVGPQAPTLLQQLVQGMRFGQTVDELARDQLWTHPALSEVVENALLAL